MSPSTPRNVNSIVNQQVGQWQSHKKDRERLAAIQPPPIITLSREFGARGAEVAEIVSKRLEYKYWDQAIVHEIAEETGARERLLESLDEHARSTMDDVVSNLLFNQGSVKDYVAELVRVINTIESHGSAVILGRGGQFIASPNRAFRVRVVCPLEERTSSYASRKEIDIHEAERQIAAKEKDRHEFIRNYFERDVTDASHYDLVVNSGTLAINGAASVIIAAYRDRFSDVLETYRIALQEE